MRMHAEGRRFVEQVRHDREARERRDIEDMRIAWEMMSPREKALVLATYYDDVEVPPEPRERKRWWRR